MVFWRLRLYGVVDHCGSFSTGVSLVHWHNEMKVPLMSNTIKPTDEIMGNMWAITNWWLIFWWYIQTQARTLPAAPFPTKEAVIHLTPQQKFRVGTRLAVATNQQGFDGPIGSIFLCYFHKFPNTRQAMLKAKPQVHQIQLWVPGGMNVGWKPLLGSQWFGIDTNMTEWWQIKPWIL